MTYLITNWFMNGWRGKGGEGHFLIIIYALHLVKYRSHQINSSERREPDIRTEKKNYIRKTIVGKYDTGKTVKLLHLIHHRQKGHTETLECCDMIFRNFSASHRIRILISMYLAQERSVKCLIAGNCI